MRTILTDCAGEFTNANITVKHAAPEYGRLESPNLLQDDMINAEIVWTADFFLGGRCYLYLYGSCHRRLAVSLNQLKEDQFLAGPQQI